jgi:hypothetical protein
MTRPSDLTRWNRAGLRRFQYVNANAATLLEELRSRLAARFPDWPGMQQPEVSQGESPEARERRVAEQYAAPRAPVPDWGWEIARAFGRATHVLVKHIDAHANEGFLGTATQWPSVRRLVAMIDYHPAPPASATTTLALEAKPGASGVVPQGLTVKYSPAAGGPPILFETLEDLPVDPELNQLHAVDWNRNLEPVSGTWLELDERVAGLASGEPVILEDQRDASLHAYWIEEVTQGIRATQIRVSPPVDIDKLVRGHVVVHLKPKDHFVALGPTRAQSELGQVVPLSKPPGMKPGDELTLQTGTRRVYRRVVGIDGLRLVLDAAVGPVQFGSASIARPATLEGSKLLQVKAGTGITPDVVSLAVPGPWSRLAGDVVADARGFDGALPLEYRVQKAEYIAPGSDQPFPQGIGGATRIELVPISSGTPHRLGAEFTAPPRLLVSPVGSPPLEIDRPLVVGDPASRLPAELVTHVPRSTVAGDLVVAVSGKQLSWGRLASVDVDAKAGRARLRPLFTWMGRGSTDDWFIAETVLYGRFAERHRLDAWQQNSAPIAGTKVPLALPVDGQGRWLVPAALGSGRKILVEQRGGDPAAAFLTTAAELDGNVLTLRHPIPEGAGFTLGNLVLSANAVSAGHGERKPEKTLGSGDATLTSQRFALAVKEVSFVADPGSPTGVRADIEVSVDGRRWRQVSDFRACGPTDAVFVVRMVEDGSLSIEFGDGQHGRRLPTGRNNVHAEYRVGVGLTGNLPPHCLEQLARPHLLLAGVRQPLGASGGNNMEGVESLRRTAPAALLTLQRCVSPDDFAALASSHASVWQARAFLRHGVATRHPLVEVVVVPAEGKPLGSLTEGLASFLRAHALPGVDVTVSRFSPDPVRLDISLEVDTAAWNPEVVVRDVRAALFDALALRRRKLGAALYLSEVYRVVEEVRGVESSVCRVVVPPGDPRSDEAEHLLSRFWAQSENHVVYVDPDDTGALAITWRRKAT